MSPQITIRAADNTDVFALRRLAALDDRPALGGSALVAEEQGELRAAIDVDSGRVIADPFAPTADLVDLLRVQRGHVATLAA
jgi:hypothetical protein